jgi:glycolate oxidase FAD binding subunit
MRGPTAEDVVQGMPPLEVHEPGSLAEAAELLALFSRAQKAVCFQGGGTQQGLGTPPRRLDALVRTARLCSVLEHAAADQVVTVEAGITLASLQRTLAGARQRLSLDPPFAARSTLGGILACNTFGPLRARYGAIRDLVLGVALVRADGVVARGGGKVVKNVAGFDLPKLLCGSLGTLGLVAQVTLRVHPLPETSSVQASRGLSTADLLGLLARLRAAQLEPAALLATRGAAGWDLTARFEGFEAGVKQQVARFAALAKADPVTDNPFDAHLAARESSKVRFKLAFKPTALLLVERALGPVLARLAGAGLSVYPGVGVGFLCAAGAQDADGLSRALAAAREELAPVARLVLEAAPLALRPLLDPWGPPPASLALHRALKDRFDPEGRLAPGRFVGGV